VRDHFPLVISAIIFISILPAVYEFIQSRRTPEPVVIVEVETEAKAETKPEAEPPAEI
jgi:hypothetical protein